MLKKIIIYALSTLAGGALIYYTYKDQNLNEVLNSIGDSNYEYIILSFFIILSSHVARAYRWNQLYNSLNYNPGLFRSFLAVMFGYFVNMAIPRGGEISRCALLKRTDNIPLEESIGTVVAERAFDLLSILVILAAAFAFNFELFSGILSQTTSAAGTETVESQESFNYWYLLIPILLVAAVAFFWNKFDLKVIINKVRTILSKVWNGVQSIQKVENKTAFLIATAIIWICYFMGSYVVFFAFPATSGLGLDAALVLLIVSTMAMIVPVPGGAAYPSFVGTAMLIYSIAANDSQVYATVMYGTNVIMIIVIGGISFVVAAGLSTRRHDSNGEKDINTSGISGEEGDIKARA